MDLPVRIPGMSEPEIIVRRSTFGGLTLLADGVPVKGQRGRYPITLPDGSVKELRLTGQWTWLKAVVDGVETPLEPPIPRYLLVLAFLPIGLVAVGGLIGGAFGGIGVAINTGVLRLQMGAPAKALAMLGVTVLSAAVFLVAAIAFRNAIAPVQTLDVGMCVNGVSEGSVIARIDPVSCSTPHDNEVVGTARYPEAGAYPGQATLEAFAAPACIAAFNTYVGRDFSSSSLDMLPILPTDATWASGDRAITCVVLARDRRKLTSSVKDAGL